MAQNADYYAGSLGFAAAFFNADPELAQLIRNAVNGQWDTTQFQGAFMNTNWYRSRSAAIRQWTDLITRDPTEAQVKIQQKMSEFRDKASQLGINWDEAYLQQVATAALSWGWTDKDTQDFFANNIDYTPGHMGGTAGAVEMQIQKLAGDYGLKLTNDQIYQFVGGIMHESYTEDNIKNFLKEMAKSKYAGMTSFLDSGMTVRQVASPYVNSYADLLEVNADSVDLNDGVIQQALQGTPPAPGQPPQMQSVYQFERQVRRDPRWQRTKNARNDVMNATQGVLKDWGLIG